MISGCMIKEFTSSTRFLKMWRLREYPISRKLRMAGMDTSNFTGEMHAYRDQSSSTKHRYQPGPHIHGHEPAWGDRATGRRRGLRHRHPLYQRVSSLHKSPTMGACQLRGKEDQICFRAGSAFRFRGYLRGEGETLCAAR